MSDGNITVGETGEHTPVSERLRFLLFVRLCMAAIVGSAPVLWSHLPLKANGLYAAGIYAGVVVVLELAQRALTRITGSRRVFLLNSMLLIDGLFVAAVLAGSGQSRSPFMFLAYVHIVSVTLLVGFRTGLKIAVWHAMLLWSAYYLVLAKILPTSQSTEIITDRSMNNQLAISAALALLLVAIVTAIFGAMNERELRRRKGELTIIADLSAVIEQTRHSHEILAALTSATTDKLQCSRALTVWSLGVSTSVVGAEGVDAPLSETLAGVGGVIEQACASTAPVLIHKIDATTDAWLAEAMPDALNIAVVPLVAEGKALAVLVAEFGDTGRRRVTRPMVNLLSNVAGRVALALSNTFLLAEVQRLASVDGLTNLANRRTFNQAIEREIARSRRSGQPVTLVMLDIDHFKAVNDVHGHQMGDTVLAESASGVLSECREEDLAARYGGEEFAVILVNCPPEDALAAAERIRHALAAANVALPETHASAGVATFPHHCDDVTGLIAAADEALYESKERGRDCTTQSTRTNERATVTSS